MEESRLERQLRFLMEVDRLKGVTRRSLVLGGLRRENSAEHSWHVALAAVLLAEHAAERVDVARVVAMLLLHDLVEIDAGDTFVYDLEARASQAERERRAADRIFGLLPSDQTGELRGLFEELERRESPEACFAASLDRLLPILHNLACGGRGWREHGVHAGQVLEVNSHVADGAPALWQHLRGLLEDAVARGVLAPPPPGPGA